MRSRKIVRKIKTTKKNTIKQRGGRPTNQRPTTVKVKLPADRTRPRMIGFNPYAYVIQIPKQAPQSMITQTVNGVSALEQLARSVQTETNQQNTNIPPQAPRPPTSQASPPASQSSPPGPSNSRESAYQSSPPGPSNSRPSNSRPANKRNITPSDQSTSRPAKRRKISTI